MAGNFITVLIKCIPDNVQVTIVVSERLTHHLSITIVPILFHCVTKVLFFVKNIFILKTELIIILFADEKCFPDLEIIQHYYP